VRLVPLFDRCAPCVIVAFPCAHTCRGSSPHSCYERRACHLDALSYTAEHHHYFTSNGLPFHAIPSSFLDHTISPAGTTSRRRTVCCPYTKNTQKMNRVRVYLTLECSALTSNRTPGISCMIDGKYHRWACSYVLLAMLWLLLCLLNFKEFRWKFENANAFVFNCNNNQ
jgi:hypothetical protein